MKKNCVRDLAVHTKAAAFLIHRGLGLATGRFVNEVDTRNRGNRVRYVKIF